MSPAPFFTTNPGEFDQVEGVVIFEQNPPGFVRGVSLGKVAIYGTTIRGPVDTPVDITSESRFLAMFGQDRQAGVTGGAIVSEVWKALLNKPFGPLVISRVADAAATTAERDFLETATARINIAATSPGAWGNDILVAIEDATDGVSTSFNLVVQYDGETVTYENLSVNGTDDNLASVIGDDLANFVVVTKISGGRPDNIAATGLTDTAGSDGTVDATDYTAAGRGLNVVSDLRGVAIVFCANEDPTITATVNASTLTAAAASSDRLFLIHDGDLNASLSSVITDVASFRNDRIVYCFNAPFTLDTETANQVQQAAVSWMASILSQTDVDINPGEESTKSFTAGISRLTDESLTRADYVSLRAAGIAALEKDVDGGFLFVSGVTTDLTSGREEITRRRSADFIQLSLANRLRFFVKKKNTAENRNQMGQQARAFLRGLQDQQRVVEAFEVDQESQNTDEGRAQGKEFILVRVRLIGHILFLIIKTEIGTGVTIEVTE